jgi:hypothetical protein
MSSAPLEARGSRMKTALVTLLLLIAAFLLGYAPKARELSAAQETLRSRDRDLRLLTLHRQLGRASHEAMQNNYPAAAQAAHAFFDGCRDAAVELDFADRPRTRLALEAYAASAPGILTQLNLGNPGTKEQLASLYLTMDGVIERKQ